MTLFYLLSISSFFIGMSRSGISALGAVSTPLLVFGLDSPKNAMAMAVVLFIMADIGALLYFRKKIDLKALLKIIPITLLGILFAFVVGKFISEELILVFITIISALAVLVLVFSGLRRNALLKSGGLESSINSSDKKPLSHYIIIIFCGIMAGITTVWGNYATTFMNLYLFEMRLKKDQFIGTLAIFYFIINLIKLFAHVFFWNSIDTSKIIELLPYWFFIVLGLIFGILIVRTLSERIFTLLVILSTISSFILLLVKIIA